MERKKNIPQELETHPCLEPHSSSSVVVVITGARCECVEHVESGGQVEMVVVLVVVPNDTSTPII